MSANHVVMGQAKPVTGLSDVTGVLPLECEHCGETAYIGMPISFYSLIALTNAFVREHRSCKGKK